MSQKLEANIIKNEGWLTGYDKTRTFKEIGYYFNETERPGKYDLDSDTLNEWNQLICKVEIAEEYDYKYRTKSVFRIRYDVVWWNIHRYVNRENEKEYTRWQDLQILENLNCEIEFTKENKSKIKAKLKRYFDSLFDENLKTYFNEKYISATMPEQVDFVENEKLHKQVIEGLFTK